MCVSLPPLSPRINFQIFFFLAVKQTRTSEDYFSESEISLEFNIAHILEDPSSSEVGQ